MLTDAPAHPYHDRQDDLSRFLKGFAKMDTGCRFFRTDGLRNATSPARSLFTERMGA
ncbi:hypothetical protein GDI2981 [Gluconacetobacter diazotrophicus PA1 5]|uniref:Uncharacterized protein n=1 Tax=Gluconacetobacter diazotrophicus (strain ATCC 49037 / DSM 5601 / CCUG 37298 / CIP 103539 / LMG 7603 / PAl5) TaxID=272568 RepID=A9HRJ5_GLUDA|nr:hypothetical protein GDI2981 [Gluconacetobacter diazotrophicus PA1 5]